MIEIRKTLVLSRAAVAATLAAAALILPPIALPRPALALPPAQSEGAYLDSAGASHHWKVNNAHTLIWDDKPFIPVGGRRMSRPGTFSLQDRNGVSHEFIGEGFGTPYNVFILLHASVTLNKATIILPAAFQPPKPDDRLV